MRGAPAILTNKRSRVVSSRRKRAKLALVGVRPDLVKRDTVLTDGVDDYRVEDEQLRLDGKWFKLYNANLPEGRHQWFRLEDLSQLAVVL